MRLGLLRETVWRFTVGDGGLWVWFSIDHLSGVVISTELRVQEM